MLRRLSIALPLCLAATAVPVLAATPADGTISNDAPKAEWTGEAAGYGTSVLADANGSFVGPCQAPNCDEFTLNVKDSADLTVALTTHDGSGFMTMEVEKPDGSIQYNGGADGAATTAMKFKKAPAGTYLVRAQTNNTVADDYAYQGLATLAVAGTAPATPPASTPPASTPPAAAPAPGATLTIRTRSASAKRAKGKLKVGVSSDQPVTQVVATLSKGKKRVGTGKLATLSGAGTVTVKVPRKLKPGRYSIAVTAKDQRGATVGAAAKLKIKR